LICSVKAVLTPVQKTANFEVWDCESHDGCLVQLSYSGLRHGQSLCQICEDLCLPAATASGCIAWLLLAFFRVPEKIREKSY
jgi:hypothetical protein